ncbi:MAG: hypothetical protein A3A51_03200 [Candidatus Levybacteria bacterium RIFCSPLOWO2_01_FULL_39_10]|nr:MAG: hypothetical protein A3A51_03200 [Candidatus Levybacteria bacterium RIFCSPLOWO2_01_FULL_39_10]
MVGFNETDRRRLKELLNEAAAADQMSDYEQRSFGLIPSEEESVTGRRFFSKTEGNLHVVSVGGKNWIESDLEGGIFLSPVSHEDFSMTLGLDGEILERHELTMPTLFPEEWVGEQIVFEINVKARKLTEDGKPI